MNQIEVNSAQIKFLSGTFLEWFNLIWKKNVYHDKQSTNGAKYNNFNVISEGLDRLRFLGNWHNYVGNFHLYHHPSRCRITYIMWLHKQPCFPKKSPNRQDKLLGMHAHNFIATDLFHVVSISPPIHQSIHSNSSKQHLLNVNPSHMHRARTKSFFNNI